MKNRRLNFFFQKNYFVHQYDKMDCGPACLAMLTAFYGKKYSIDFLREKSFISKDGVSLLNIENVGKEIGMETFALMLTLDELKEKRSLLPSILHWNQNHFIVLREIRKNKSGEYIFHISDPAHGQIKINADIFSKSWLSQSETGVSLFMHPKPEFHQNTAKKDDKISYKYLLNYIKIFKKKLFVLAILLFVGSGLTIIFPFLTQELIDKGVSRKNLNFVTVILLAQLILFAVTIIIQVFRNWIVLSLGTKLSINIISGFLKRTLYLPIKFFDSKTIGDFNQRIQDNNRVEDFLTSQGLTTFFSIVTFSVFLGVLLYYDLTILIVFLGLTFVSILWTLFWLKRRKILDYRRFQQSSLNQESIYELLNGVTEMKLNQFEEYKINEWKLIQQDIFSLNTKILKVDQIQLSGFEFLNQVKNILVTFLAASFVVEGHMSLGVLLSISYIIGQMNSPINQLLNFLRSLQDAKLSLKRLNEIQNRQPEEYGNLKSININDLNNNILRGINLNIVSFQYEGPNSPFVLKDIKLSIPEGKVTAVVGASGSGKTTLMKLLLRFYDPSNGLITYNGDDILTLSPKSIRENCGVVMQDGYIFSDTIERNIATSDENIDIEKLEHAAKVANIESFIKSLPLGYNTKIGAIGNGISGGQRQRILIARAVYKNPHYIFFDEATSALDAENEKIIHDNLQSFFKGKTVLIIAHRLSTVKNADHIIVLNHGEIVEQGSHQELVVKKNEYYNLVKNQLELGS